jgi:hypothetical protein
MMFFMFANLLTNAARSVGLSTVMRAAGVLTRLLPISQPTMLVGPGCSARLGQAINDFGHHKVLIVTDSVITRLGLTAPLTQALTAGGTRFVVFDAISADAPVEQIELGIAFLNAEGCDAVVAFGGGSAMDAAKTMALAVANHKHPRELVGYFKGWRAPLPLYAVPTTAGTGSEVTVAAVISDPDHHRKLVIADTRLVPRMAALDPSLMVGLPPDVTAATGMDALTHAIEAYIGHWAPTSPTAWHCQRCAWCMKTCRWCTPTGKTWRRAKKWRWPPTMRARPSPAPTWGMCTPLHTSWVVCTTRRTDWPTPSCCRMCCDS